jgi:hypothetical protein
MTNFKTYPSFEACVAEHMLEFYANKSIPPDDVKLFWNKIDECIEAYGDLMSEGNSGEFHNEAESKRIEKQFKKSQEELVSIFELQTGWKPVFIDINKNIYIEIEPGKKQGAFVTGYWAFIKKKITVGDIIR